MQLCRRVSFEFSCSKVWGRSCAVKLIASPAPAQPLQVVSRVHALKGLREQISLRQIFDPFVPVQNDTICFDRLGAAFGFHGEAWVGCWALRPTSEML